VVRDIESYGPDSTACAGRLLLGLVKKMVREVAHYLMFTRKVLYIVFSRSSAILTAMTCSPDSKSAIWIVKNSVVVS